MRSAIEEFLCELEKRLQLPAKSKARVLAETKSHLLVLAKRFIAYETSQEEAERRAVETFGKPEEYAAMMTKHAVRRGPGAHRAVRVLSVLTGAFVGFVFVTFGMWDLSEGVLHPQVSLTLGNQWTPVWLVGGVGGGALLGATRAFRRWWPMFLGALAGLFVGIYVRDQISLHPLFGEASFGYRQPSAWVLLTIVGGLVAAFAGLFLVLRRLVPH